ncbi:MAG: MATE family efflux transporter [Gammaproteobacteria bacterium]|jgi:MATE family multidrug resistance protein
MNQPANGYNHRAIWAIALPMMLSGISLPLVGLVDTGVMGHLDRPNYLAAVAANTTIFSFALYGLNFLRMSTTGMTAQAYGSRNHARITESLAQPLVIAAGLACLLLLLQWPLRELGLWILAPGQETAQLARDYFDIRIWSAPAVLANFVIVGWLLGMQNARGPLLIMLTVNISNVLMDLWFVVGLDMTVTGVALATVLAEYTGLSLGLVFVRAELGAHKPVWRFDHYRELKRYLPLFSINANLFLRSMALMFTFGFITAQGARLGDVVLATNALLMNFIFFMAYALDGIAHAAEALTGKAIGASDRPGLEKAVAGSLLWTGIFASLFSMLYLFAGDSIIATLSDLPEIRATANTYLPWLIAAPLICAWCFLYDGVYIGITRAKEMRIVMFSSTALVFLPSWYLFRDWGNHALWLALMLFMAARGIGMHVWFRRLLHNNRLLPDYTR